MSFHVIHIVTDFTKINFGVWNAALFGSTYLREKFKVNTIAIACCKNPGAELMVNDIPIIWAGNFPSVKDIIGELNENSVEMSNAIVVSHGCWKQPTRVAYQLRKFRIRWLYVPHGMLEPWSLANHWLKKMIYFHLIEKRLSKRADSIRAVSKTEHDNLKILLNRSIITVGNGVVVPQMPVKSNDSMVFLFMARLHFKKGIVPLVKAWHAAMRNANATLIIAGPDEGELEKIKSMLNGNVSYVGATYGEEKEELLKQAHYYVLPSFSEGFPTSVVEAMSYGAIPIISKGCNFPEVFNNDLGFQVEPDEKSIRNKLASVATLPFDEARSRRNYEFINLHYSEDAVSIKLYDLYTLMLNPDKIG